MSRAQQVARSLPPPSPSAFAQGYCDATDGEHQLHNRIEYAKMLYPRDAIARRAYLDGWLTALAEPV
jgi:hypothetical protein